MAFMLVEMCILRENENENANEEESEDETKQDHSHKALKCLPSVDIPSITANEKESEFPLYTMYESATPVCSRQDTDKHCILINYKCMSESSYSEMFTTISCSYRSNALETSRFVDPLYWMFKFKIMTLWKTVLLLPASTSLTNVFMRMRFPLIQRFQ